MKLKKNIIVIFMVLVSAFAKADIMPLTTMTTTQCAMCRAVLESEEDNSTAKGINNGIKYLMIIPYILVGGVFYVIYKSRKKDKEKQSQDSLTKS
jgi:hypothetical protein